MPEILNIIQKTSQRFLNMFELSVKDRTGKVHPYYVASRAETIEKLKLKTKKNTPDGVIIYAVYGEKRDRLVVIRQYRYSIDDYIYELPAGLVDPGETDRLAAIREMKEETGLDFVPADFPEYYSRPLFTTIGMTDESCGTIYGTATGNPSSAFLEPSEDISVKLIDRAEAIRILQEENVSVMCGYLMMNFINAVDEPFWFLK